MQAAGLDVLFLALCILSFIDQHDEISSGIPQFLTSRIAIAVANFGYSSQRAQEHNKGTVEFVVDAINRLTGLVTTVRWPK